MKVLLLSRYGPLGASSRVRSLQYLPYLESQGVKVTVKPLLSDAYVSALYNGGDKRFEIIKGYLSRLFLLLTAKKYDVVIVEKEIFPFLPAFAERFLHLIKVPYLVDYDDAIFHNYDLSQNKLVRFILAKKIDTVMRLASVVTAGNKYLAERAVKSGANKVEIIPTVVDSERYTPKNIYNSEDLIVGWIGTPSTSKYLKPLLPVFDKLQKKYGTRFVAVGANQETFKNSVVEAWPWSEDTEVASIQKFDIGIMPLVDSPWERGKCGYKLIQYMACGVPVVGSPVGVNTEIISLQINGDLASEPDEWFVVLERMLISDAEQRKEMGIAGRKIVEQCYSRQAQSLNLLNSIYVASQVGQGVNHK